MKILMVEEGIQGGKIDLALRSIKSSFEMGEVTKMYELSTLFPTKIIKALGLNHGRYVAKLSKPEKFSIEEIVRFSRLIGVDHNKVIEVILREAVQNVISKETEKGKKKLLKKNTTTKKPDTKVNRPKNPKK